MSGKLFDQIFNLKFLAKQLNRQAKKCEKDEKSERLKVKKAIEKGNMDGAQIYAQNAIRKKAEMLNYLRLASRLDAVVSRLDSQAKMQLVTKNMAGIVKSLEKALTSNNLEKVAQTMESFEKQFENLDVQSDFVNEAMNKQAALSTNEDEVKNLMHQVADEHGLELASALPGAGAQHVASSAQEAVPQDELTKRLAELRGK